MEHRCGTRYAVDVPVYVRTRNAALSASGQLCEVSITGGFVRTVLPAQPLSYIAIQLLADEKLPREVLFVEGQVVHRTRHGLGIEWSEYAPRLVRHLTGWTARQHESAPPVDPLLKWEA
jgi:hypothetical protein